jgi:hypothetical protein|tara:strand:- start:3478 stop:3984 length:507 start_codon:yes stop_codon:yes gene_type:complete
MQPFGPSSQTWAEEWVMQEQDFNEDDVQDQEQQHRDPVRSHMRKLEAENKELRQLKAEAEEAKKKIAFVEAGIDLASPMSKYFIKAYDGDMSADAIRAAAAEANLTQPKAPQMAPQEQQAWNRMGNAARSGDIAEPVVDYAARMANAKSESEVMELLAQARANQSNII